MVEEQYPQALDVADEDLQLAENITVDDNDIDLYPTAEEKRNLLRKTKIVKQTWSIQEIYQKIKTGRLKLSPDYQRNEIWQDDKKTAFIESLYMGIIIPPIYVVEIPGADLLEDSTYEVVDGKQRLTTIEKFLTNKISLSKKNLEYYRDWFGGKKYEDIRDQYSEQTSEMLSSVLDIYVITANSPEFTKYDIFSRLNKGAEKLKVNEIRKAIYRSPLLEQIDSFVRSYTDGSDEKKQEYLEVFSSNDIKRYEDYGRFYASVAFAIRSDLTTFIVLGYNSRPRDMINAVLQEVQDKQAQMTDEEINKILKFTLLVRKEYKTTDGIDYIINACVPYVRSYNDLLIEKLPSIMEDSDIKKTLTKSPATTSNVNQRLKRVSEIMNK